jgi:ABC-2 type transport system ATP-binding protein
MTVEILGVKNLEKSYLPSFKLGPLNFSVEAHETVALMGKNGSGKSTLFQILTGNADATSGQVTLLGKKMLPEAYELKRSLGYLPQNFHLPRWVTPLELLTYAAKLFNLPDAKKSIQDTLAYWDSGYFMNKPLAACSYGMQKRVALALATIHEPKLLILDEPFSGLDLFHIRALMATIERRNSQNLATILSTHVAPYAAKLCQRTILLKDGNLEQLAHWQDRSYLEKIEAIESYFFDEKATPKKKANKN